MKSLISILFIYLLPAAWLLNAFGTPSAHSVSASAGSEKPVEEVQETEADSVFELDMPVTAIGEVGKKYRESRGITMGLKKRVFSAIMEKEYKSEGSLLYSKGRFKMKIKKPTKAMVIVDGDLVWVVNQFSKSEGGKTQVSKYKSSSNKSGVNTLLATIFDESKLFKAFKILKTERKGELTHYSLAPKDLKKSRDFIKVFIKIHEREGVIKEFSYKDDEDNETTYTFSKVKFGAKISKKEFKYSPPKDAEVTVF